MSDVRARLAAALRGHQRNPYGQHDGWWECSCSTDEPHTPEHLANALLSLEGVAIVALPEPVGSRWPVDDDDDFTVSTVELVRASNAFAATPRRHPGCKVEWGSVELNLCTRDARALAAALLAAADVAEVATS